MTKALILGGTKGLGEAIAHNCLERGWDVTVIGSSVNDGERTKQCDLTDPDQVNQVADWIATQSFDYFFWCAGSIVKGEFHALSREDIIRVTNVNYAGALPIVHAAWKRMFGTTSAKTFTVIASSSGLKARKEEQVYCGTKWAQVGFTKSLALENTNENLTILLVTPGGMQTPFWKEKPQDYDTYNDPKKVAEKIVENVRLPGPAYRELDIPRGSL